MPQQQLPDSVTLTMKVTPRNELEIPRERSFTYRIHQADKIRLWEPPFDNRDGDGCQRQNLTVETAEGQVALYGMTSWQLADLYSQIGNILGKPPAPTIHHLRQARDVLNKLIAESDASPDIEHGTPDQPPEHDGYSL